MITEFMQNTEFRCQRPSSLWHKANGFGRCAEQCPSCAVADGNVEPSGVSRALCDQDVRVVGVVEAEVAEEFAQSVPVRQAVDPLVLDGRARLRLEDRVLAVEQELRSIRAALAAVTRCTCPIGFGSQPDPNCPKHGNRGS